MVDLKKHDKKCVCAFEIFVLCFEKFMKKVVRHEKIYQFQNPPSNLRVSKKILENKVGESV
jgi:hypothetical protein